MHKEVGQIRRLPAAVLPSEWSESIILQRLLISLDDDSAGCLVKTWPTVCHYHARHRCARRKHLLVQAQELAEHNLLDTVFPMGATWVFRDGWSTSGDSLGGFAYPHALSYYD